MQIGREDARWLALINSLETTAVIAAGSLFLSRSSSVAAAAKNREKPLADRGVKDLPFFGRSLIFGGKQIPFSVK